MYNLSLGNVNAFVKDLEDVMLTIPSYFDFSDESNDQTFLLGLTASLKKTHYVYSNIESGLGRPDMLLVPKETSNHLGVIFELKKEVNGKNINTDNDIASDGLKQIEIKKYASHLKLMLHVNQVLNFCIFFYGKNFVYKYFFEPLNND